MDFVLENNDNIDVYLDINFLCITYFTYCQKKKIECNELITWDLRPMLRTTEIKVKFIAPKTTLIVYLFSI